MVKLGFYAWIHNERSTYHHGLKTFAQACRLRENHDSKLKDFIAYLLQIMDTATIIDTLHDSLKGSPVMRGKHLEDCLIALETFLVYGGQPALDAYYKKPMLLAICTALRRDSLQSSSLRRKSDWRLKNDVRVWVQVSTQIM